MIKPGDYILFSPSPDKKVLVLVEKNNNGTFYGYGEDGINYCFTEYQIEPAKEPEYILAKGDLVKIKGQKDYKMVLDVSTREKSLIVEERVVDRLLRHPVIERHMYNFHRIEDIWKKEF